MRRRRAGQLQAGPVHDSKQHFTHAHTHAHTADGLRQKWSLLSLESLWHDDL